jgi:hypothetical protein
MKMREERLEREEEESNANASAAAAAAFVASPESPANSLQLREPSNFQLRKTEEAASSEEAPSPFKSMFPFDFSPLRLLKLNLEGATKGTSSQPADTPDTATPQTTTVLDTLLDQEKGSSYTVTSASTTQDGSLSPQDGSLSPQGLGEWKAEIDPPTGKTYYWNTETKETTWDRPEGFRD